MALKYKKYLDTAPQPCPCSKRFQPRAVTAYRFVKKKADASDFVPKAIQENMGTGQSCAAYGLSFFNSLASARTKFASLKAGTQNIGTVLGNHIGEIDLDLKDGEISLPSPLGHMCLHPYDGRSFVDRLKDIQPAAHNAPASPKGGN